MTQFLKKKSQLVYEPYHLKDNFVKNKYLFIFNIFHSNGLKSKTIDFGFLIT